MASTVTRAAMIDIMDQAINNERARLNKRTVELGDLLCESRQDNAGLARENRLLRQKCDILTRFKEAREEEEYRERIMKKKRKADDLDIGAIDELLSRDQDKVKFSRAVAEAVAEAQATIATSHATIKEWRRKTVASDLEKRDLASVKQE